MTLTGSNLNLVTAISVGGVSQPNFYATASSLSFAVPTQAVGSGKVIQLTTPTSTINASTTFAVKAGTVAPSRLKASPARGSVGSTVTISGTDLASVTAVKFGTTSAPFVVTGSGSILAAVPNAAAGSAPITVVSTGGTSTSTAFTIQATSAAPTITSVDLTQATVGNVITVTGTNLAGVTAISFNSVAVTSFKVISGTQISFVVPNSATSGAFTVTAVGGSATYSGTITIY